MSRYATLQLYFSEDDAWIHDWVTERAKEVELSRNQLIIGYLQEIAEEMGEVPSLNKAWGAKD